MVLSCGGATFYWLLAKGTPNNYAAQPYLLPQIERSDDAYLHVVYMNHCLLKYGVELPRELAVYVE